MGQHGIRHLAETGAIGSCIRVIGELCGEAIEELVARQKDAPNRVTGFRDAFAVPFDDRCGVQLRSDWSKRLQDLKSSARRFANLNTIMH